MTFTKKSMLFASGFASGYIVKWGADESSYKKALASILAKEEARLAIIERSRRSYKKSL